VGVIALEVDGVKFIVNVWVNPSDFMASKLALHEKIINDLVADGIKLPGM
jgi:small conductance mechanosensitive channel